MSPNEYADTEGEQQAPEIEEVSEDDTSDTQNKEQDGNHEEMEAKFMTMEERKAKMQRLRAKMVRRARSMNHNWLLTTVTAVVCARKPCLCNRRIFEVQERRP